MARAFESRNPGVKIHLEGSGARVVARKVIQQPYACDIVASADYSIIDDFLRPEYASFNICVARNRLVLSFTDRSRHVAEINSDNWYKILLRPGVVYGHTDPELDPAGYRARLCWQLAEKYYKEDGLGNQLIAKLLPANILTDGGIIRELLTNGELDYFFGYESTARQNGYRFINLPDAINLSSEDYSAVYKQVELVLAGKYPGTSMVVKGQPITYGISLVETTRQREQAVRFLEFLLEQGEPYIAAAGLIPLSPPILPAGDYACLPVQLRRFFVE